MTEKGLYQPDVVAHPPIRAFDDPETLIFSPVCLVRFGHDEKIADFLVVATVALGAWELLVR
ncbi:MAG: hypothetical protein CM1200mP18_17780 [Gammaproteobacteria bacterium]|nr:MAG: hypothetical protein CM1200mP18_17780 [Gammaproteobacteria bacterium]